MKFIYPERLKLYIKSLDNSPIVSLNKGIGWHSVIIGVDGEPLGGGTTNNLETAKRIAVAESLEKLELLHGLTDGERELFRCEKFPTRCGIAVGFDKIKTSQRATAEAIERWAWSKWIDEGYSINKIDPPDLTQLGFWASTHFDEISYFQKTLQCNIPGFPSETKFCAIMAIKDGGAYPGSRLCGAGEDAWTHATLEGWRNLQMSKVIGDRKRLYPFLADRVAFFSKNSEHAKKATALKNYENWPNAEIDFIESLDRNADGYFITRAICSDFIPWHLGSSDRFVY